MPKHKDQRVGIFVDVQNLYYSAKQFYHSKVNFAHILSRGISGRELIRAIAYVIKADIKEEENFFEALEKIGYDVRSKDLQTFYGGAKKGDWDVGIAMDIMRMAAKLDVIVLVSGDGDFKDLLEHVKALGCRAEVIGFRKTVSSRLLAEADEFIDLDKELSRVLIKDQRKRRHNNYKQKSEPASMIQKINMDQPDLSKSEKKEIKMPEEKPAVQKKPQPPVKKDDKPAEKKKEDKPKRTQKKSKSVISNVIKKVKGKK